jgi:hypothetical protein
MTVISGQRRTDNVAAEQREIDLATEILFLEGVPDAAPLTTISKRIKDNTRPCVNSEYAWEEDERDVRFDAVNEGAGFTKEATEVVVDTGEVFYTAALITCPRTGEIMYVSKVETNTLTVKRGFAGSTAAALVDNDPLYVIGAVAEEGATSFEARSKNPTKISNYTEIFRTSIEASGTWLSSSNKTSPHDWIHQHRKKNLEHMLDIENAGLFGSPSESAGTSGKIRTTGGALHFLTQNNQDMGGTMTESELESWVRSICRFGNKKTVFCSALALSVINNYAVGRLQSIQADRDTTYGVSAMEYITAHGSLKLVKHNLLEGATWGGYMIAIDFALGAPTYRYLGGEGAPGGARDTKLLTNRQANDADGQKDEMLTECGFMWPQVKRGGVATGITG